MERTRQVAGRAREVFSGRFDEVLDIIRRDRQEMAIEEPDHVRTIVRRALREAAGGETAAGGKVAVAEEIGLGVTATEPDPSAVRETFCQFMDSGIFGLQKISRSQTPDLTEEERLGVEWALLVYGRPAVLIRQGHLASPSPFWSILDEQREGIEMAHRGVGRIEMLGHPEYDWAGTGFLVSETCLMTTRQTAEVFAERKGDGQWQFRPGITVWMDYRSLHRPGTEAGYRVRGIRGAHADYDLALLDVEPPRQAAEAPQPLTLASQAPSQIAGRWAYLICYPERDQRRNEPEEIARIFREVYNVKRVQPGTLRGVTAFDRIYLLGHDCAMLGRCRGGCLIDLETHQVLGMHVSGRYLEDGTAVPLWLLRDDPLLQRNGVRFADVADRNLKEELARKLERLLDSRFRANARATIDNLYQRAFGQ